MNEHWKYKISRSKNMTNSTINKCYDFALTNGALGGKIVGAGGGGFLLLFVPPERQKKVRENLTKFHEVKFKFEFNGSELIHK